VHLGVLHFAAGKRPDDSSGGADLAMARRLPVEVLVIDYAEREPTAD